MTIDIDAIRKRLDATYATPSFALREDCRALLSHIAALEAAHEAELWSVINYVVGAEIKIRRGEEHLLTPGKILAAFRAHHKELVNMVPPGPVDPPRTPPRRAA